jgi:hypothetical protein
MPSISAIVGSALAAAALLVTGAEAQCKTPAAGLPVTINPCTGAGAAVTWNFTTGTSGLIGSFQLSGTSLCLGLFGIYQPSGSPAATLLPCDVNDPSQRWAPNLPLAPPTQYFSGLDGNALDVFNNEVAAGTQLETYSMKASPGNENQLFSWSGASGQLTSDLNGFCVSVC